MIGLGYFLLFLGLIRFCVAGMNFFSFHYLPRQAKADSSFSVSVLVPARNEAFTIGKLLEGLKQFRYPKLEILVYDDHSKDATREVVKHYLTEIPELKLLEGKPLPEGWLGKNHACYQLAQEASGDYLLFLDADTEVAPGLVERALIYTRKHHLKLLSIFPQQQVENISEKISVPLMNWILLSLLPMILIRISKNPAFAAANGQFMFFEAQTYRKIQPHQRFRNNRVEDIAISHFYKTKGLKTDTLLGNRYIRCRMYTNLSESIHGFSKNIVRFFGGSLFATLFFTVVTTFWPLLFLAGWQYGVAYLALAAGIRIFVSLASKQNVLENLIYALPQHFIFLCILVKALIQRNKKQLLWKDRNIYVS